MSGLWTRVSSMRFPWEFSSPLALASWFVLAGVPVGIIALYFLKLRRRPVRVASTILWRRSLEDLHVNSLFQWIKRNILLLLQLLVLVVFLYSLLGFRYHGSASRGRSFCWRANMVWCSGVRPLPVAPPIRTSSTKGTS